MRTDISRFFAKPSAFSEACDLYDDRFIILPPDVLKAGEARSNGRLAFLLGYCFRLALEKRGMNINPDELTRLSEAKINQTDPREFVRGFRVCEMRAEGSKLR